ncbi:hypothetical protein NHX12_010023 [Muraenolepis orangiensis]|uniref:Uncharacterized protein n=1 Tax=Muraenolepis orangiensis TaxID=630683 RepID=A0A9Q0DLF1_9TELE|nr:hypothetical protein NHX12_010023 [Muraenolepis orangiensis]
MSSPPSLQGLRGSSTSQEIRNKTQIQRPHAGDANANQLGPAGGQAERGTLGEDGYSTRRLQSFLPHREAHQLPQYQYSMPKEEEEEEDEDFEDGGSFRDGKDEEGPMSISSSSTASSASCGGKKSGESKRGGETQKDGRIQRKHVCHSSEELDACVEGSVEREEVTHASRGRERERRRPGSLKESKSETNVFASSCLTAVSLSGSLASALDSSGVAQPPLPNPNTSYHPGLYNATSAQARRRAPAPVDANQNSAPAPVQHGLNQDWRQEECYGNGLSSSDARLGLRRKGGFEERVLPPRRQQLVRPLCQSETGRGWGLAEPMTTAPQREPEQADCQSQGTNKRFLKSALREPSDISHLYNIQMLSQQRQSKELVSIEAQSLDRQPSTARRTSSPSALPPSTETRAQAQLTYRRNCSSPNRSPMGPRTSTPPHSPLRTPQGSPRRLPSMFLVSRTVSGPRQPQPGTNPAVEASSQGYNTSGLRPPVKTNISTSGIPKAPTNQQQQQSSPNRYPNSSPRETSPFPKGNLKPKGVRPKIITSVRKSPQLRPQVVDGPYQVSSLPSRLSAYSQTQASPPREPPQRDSPPDGSSSSRVRGSAVFSASNLLFERYRQEVQTNLYPPPGSIRSGGRPPPGHTHTLPTAHTHTGAHAHAHSHTAPPKLAGKGDVFYGTPSDKRTLPETGRPASFGGISSDDSKMAAQVGATGSLLRSGRGLRLGLGAVARTTTGSVKGRGPAQGQRSSLVFSQPVQAVSRVASQKSQENTDAAASCSGPICITAQRSHGRRSLQPPRAGQSGLRPPGFTSNVRPGPAGRLGAVSFARSSSVSSGSSGDSAPPPRPTQPGGLFVYLVGYLVACFSIWLASWWPVCLSGGLPGGLFVCLVGYLVGWLVACLSIWWAAWWPVCLSGRLPGGLFVCLVGYLVGWLVACFSIWWAGWCPVCLSGGLPVRLVGGLFVYLVGWQPVCLPGGLFVDVVVYLVACLSTMWWATWWPVCRCGGLPGGLFVDDVVGYLVACLSMWWATWWPVCRCGGLPGGLFVDVVSYLVACLSMWWATWWPVCRCGGLPGGLFVDVVGYLVACLSMWWATWWPVCRCGGLPGGLFVDVVGYLVACLWMWWATWWPVCGCGGLPGGLFVDVVGYLVACLSMWWATWSTLRLFVGWPTGRASLMVF